MDNLGAIIGPLLALGLITAVGVRWAIGLSVVPGLLAAAAIGYAIHASPTPQRRERTPLRLRVRPALRGQLGRLLGAVAAFEVGNVAATLLILRATELLNPGSGTAAATTIALVLYTGYNLAATLASVPAGRLADQLGARGPVLVLAAGLALFAAAYTGFTLNGPNLAPLTAPFIAAGVGIGCVKTAEHAAIAALAAPEIRGSAFGLLATLQAAGNLTASAIAGLLWTALSPAAAFGYLVAWMLLALILLLTTGRHTEAH
jgi:MFS family permease